MHAVADGTTTEEASVKVEDLDGAVVTTTLGRSGPKKGVRKVIAWLFPTPCQESQTM